MAPASKIADPQPPQEPERHQGENAHVHPRNHQHVIGARALKVGAGGAVDEGVFTDHHGVHQRGFARRPQGVDFVDDAAMDPRPPEFSPAADKAGKDLDAFGSGGGQGDDPVFREVSPVVKCARDCGSCAERRFWREIEGAHRSGTGVRHLRLEQARFSAADKHLCASRS